MTEIKIVQADITKLKIDAIVNAANKSLLGGGGVDGAIHRAAGPHLLEECKTLNGCDTGDAKLTKGYNLPAKFIIHTVGPIWHGGRYGEKELLMACYKNSLDIARKNGIKTVAFPAISCGVCGYPLPLAVQTALEAVKEYIKTCDDIDEIIFVGFDRKAVDVYKKYFYADNHPLKQKSREELAAIAQETIAISNVGYYELNNKLILLPAYEDIIVYSPELLKYIDCNMKNLAFIVNPDNKPTKYSVINADSFETVKGYERPFVMNFADAYIPGGGFLGGSRAQEESLCRNSNLYQSLTTEKASEMYRYNIKHKELNCYSDYMLLSKNVCVFRNAENELLEEPYLVDVITIAAPNKKGAAFNVDREELYSVMKNRLRHMFNVAINNSNKTLVLGAWGCGAFGNSTKDVAQIFYELLCVENYEKHFDNIIFAIYNDLPKFEIFQKIFRNRLV